MQQPTVLVRIFGTTRDTLLGARQRRGGQDWGPMESLAEVTDRLVTAGLKPHATKKKPARRRRHRIRGKVKARRRSKR